MGRGREVRAARQCSWLMWTHPFLIRDGPLPAACLLSCNKNLSCLGQGSVIPLCLFSAISVCHTCMRGDPHWEGTRCNFSILFSAPVVCTCRRKKNGRGRYCLALCEGHLKRLPIAVDFLLARARVHLASWQIFSRGTKANTGNFSGAELFRANTFIQCSHIWAPLCKALSLHRIVVRGRLRDLRHHLLREN